ISGGGISPPTPQKGDWRMLLAFGPSEGEWVIRPGEEFPITVAFIAGGDTTEGSKNADWALRLYQNDFQGPAAPNAPIFSVMPYPDRVRISWRPNAETSIDPITQEADFEGYLIERSFNQQDWHALAYYDREDTLEGEFEWQNYNLGMPKDTLRFEDGHWEYYFDDTDLIPGHSYYYVVRAFDKGVAGAGILMSSRTGNYQETKTVRTETTGAQHALGDIYVYPNPYKGSHHGEQGGEVNPSKGLIEYPRKLYFGGLPPSTAPGQCKIKIFSLAGDHLITLNHTNGTEQETWNLLTMNKQEIVSGIYLYTVEYKKPGSDSWDRFIDKFVVLK
ncbi:MAG: fibronectin type III domain-containing protein, partial [bacterium]